MFSPTCIVVVVAVVLWSTVSLCLTLGAQTNAKNLNAVQRWSVALIVWLHKQFPLSLSVSLCPPACKLLHRKFIYLLANALGHTRHPFTRVESENEKELLASWLRVHVLMGSASHPAGHYLARQPHEFIQASLGLAWEESFSESEMNGEARKRASE